MKAAAAAGAMAVFGVGVSAQAQEEYVLGLSGALSGPAGTLYTPMVEGINIYFQRLNDAGGIKGRKVRIVIRDNANDPLRAVGDLKAFDGDKAVNLVLFPSTSGTIGAYTRESRKLAMPTILVNPCYPPATSPAPNPEFFCPGISTLVDANSFVDLMIELMKGKTMKLAFVTSDVPGAKIAAQGMMAPYAKKKGVEVVDIAVVPVPTTDLVPIIRGLQDKGANAIISYTFNHHMLAVGEAIGKLNYKVTYLMAGQLPGVLKQIEDMANPDIYALDHFSLVTGTESIAGEIRDAAKKYGYKFPLHDIRFGWRAAIVAEAALAKCGWPCSREKLVEAMNDLVVDDKRMIELNGGPVVFTKTNHTSLEKRYRVYHWDSTKKSLVTAVDWFAAKEIDWVIK